MCCCTTAAGNNIFSDVGVMFGNSADKLKKLIINDNLLILIGRQLNPVKNPVGRLSL